MAGKWPELLKEIAPRVNRVAILFNPATAPYADYFLNFFKAAAASLAVQAIVAPVRELSELESVAATQAGAPDGALIVMPDTFMNLHRAELISLAAHHPLPTIYSDRIFAERGGLLSYGNNRPDNFRRAASYVDRILKGEKPEELPVQAPTKFELVVNLKTAKALGLDVPLQLQQRADEVDRMRRGVRIWSLRLVCEGRLSGPKLIEENFQVCLVRYRNIARERLIGSDGPWAGASKTAKVCRKLALAELSDHCTCASAFVLEPRREIIRRRSRRQSRSAHL